MSSTEDKSLSPPLGAVKSYDKLLKLLESRTIPKVDVPFLEDYKIASGNETKFIAGLKFLGLIDKDGNAKEELNSLCNVESKRKENLERIVRKAYSLLFDVIKIDLAKADSDMLISAFKNDYQMGSMNTAISGARIFVYLAQKSGITFSDSILKKVSPVVRKEEKTGITNQKKTKIQLTKLKKSEAACLPEEVIARFELKGTGHVDIKSKDDFEIAKAYWKTLWKKLGVTEEE